MTKRVGNSVPQSVSFNVLPCAFILSRDFREEKYNLSPLQLACNPFFFLFRFTMMLAPIFVLCVTYFVLFKTRPQICSYGMKI